MNGDTLALLVGGGPAPGINGVIASATIEAVNSGLRVLGVYDGYYHLARGDTNQVTELGIEQVSLIHASGGSILRTSRTNPAKDEATLQRCVRSLTVLGVRYLVAIGGDDTTYGAARIAETMRGRIGVATVPKTIDNDLPLPDNAPTFGFETARSVGTGIIESLLEDARTTARWYLVVSMGRKSGALALGMCKAAGADLAVIPEEFSAGELDLDAVVDTIVGAIVKRRSQNHNNGVAVIAEGIAERLSQEQLERFESAPRDAYGHIRLADIPIGAVLRDAVRKRLSAIGIEATVVNKDIGYELRCAKPVPFDVRIHAHARVRCGSLFARRWKRRADCALRRPRRTGYAAAVARCGHGPRARAHGGHYHRVLSRRPQLHDAPGTRRSVRTQPLTACGVHQSHRRRIQRTLRKRGGRRSSGVNAPLRPFFCAALLLAACAGGGSTTASPSGTAGAAPPAQTACAASTPPAAPAGSAPPAGGLTVAGGFTVAVVAHVPGGRELAFAPNGDLFVGTSGKSTYIVQQVENQAAAPHVFATFSDSPAAGVAFSTANCSLYVGTQFGVYRIPYADGDATARSAPVKIAGVRPGGSADHSTTSLAVSGTTLFASVGSSCNACTESDPTRATIQQMNLDGSGITPKAIHIRNAIALTIDPGTGTLWAGDAGQDDLPAGRPYEFFDGVTLHPGVVDYGWPNCEEDRIAYHAGANCSSVAVPLVEFPAYETIVGATFYVPQAGAPYAFPLHYRGGAFVTMHGSWHANASGVPVSPPRVAFVPMLGDAPQRSVDWSDPTSQWSDFLTGFQRADGTRTGRPTGIAVGPDGDLFVADDQSGNIYRIRP